MSIMVLTSAFAQKQNDREHIGGIGVSGGTSDQDEQCAQAGIEAVKGELM